MLVVKTENIFTGWQKTFQTQGSLKIKGTHAGIRF
jgi:hypothetical protein